MKIERGKLLPAGGLTATDLAAFRNGGQVEMASYVRGRIYVAAINRIAVEGNELRLGFSWVLKGEGYPPYPKRWVRDDEMNSYNLKLEGCTIADIGPGMDGGGNQGFIQCQGGYYTSLIFYPLDGPKFDSVRLEKLLTAPRTVLFSPEWNEFDQTALQNLTWALMSVLAN